MLKTLREEVCQANLRLKNYNLVALTWGNVSGIDRQKGMVVIKPSGIDYDVLQAADMVILDLDGNTVEGKWRPSSDTPTHLALYRSFKNIGGIAHTHSLHATMFAQACREIPCLGTTHADHFHGSIPVTRYLNEYEVQKDYEFNTGKVIIERFSTLNPEEMPAVLVAGHGPFTWGYNPEEAVENSLVLEQVAKISLGTLRIEPGINPLPEYILRKHHQRKHGPDAYYGQPEQELRNKK